MHTIAVEIPKELNNAADLKRINQVLLDKLPSGCKGIPFSEIPVEDRIKRITISNEELLFWVAKVLIEQKLSICKWVVILTATGFGFPEDLTWSVVGPFSFQEEANSYANDKTKVGSCATEVMPLSNP